MEYNLKQFLDGATVIPFRDDTLSELETICNAYIGDEEPLSIIDEISSYLYADTIPTDFTKFLHDSIIQSNIGFSKISESLKIRLAQYVLYQTIIKEEDLCERSFLCSNWMNYTLLKHRNLSSLPNSTLLSQLCKFHIHSYVMNLYNTRNSNGNRESEVRKLLSLIPFNDYEENLFAFGDPSVWNAMKDICAEATLLRINALISRFQVEQPNLQNIYRILNGIVDILDYPYYNIDIVNIVDKITKGKKNIQIELQKYIKDLQNAGISPICNLDSSVILRAIRHKDDNFCIKKKSVKLGLREFSVYLFYELLLEKIESTKDQEHE